MPGSDAVDGVVIRAYDEEPSGLPKDERKAEGQRPTEATPLMDTTSPPPSQLKDSVLVKTLSFGLNGFFFSAYIVANSKLIALLGEEQSGAGAIVSPYQSVLLGTSVGIVLSIGLELGPYVGKKDYTGAGDAIRTAWILTVTSGALSSAAMLATRAIFPLLFETQTARAGSDFFTGCSIGNIPMLMLVTNSQIAYQEGDWFIPGAVGFLLFASAVPLSYALAFPADMGAFGIGLGGSIAQVLVCTGLQSWFTRPSYKKYNFHQLTSIPEFGEKMKKLLSLGWKLSAQRLTEWANLVCITTVIGVINNDALKAASPATQYVSLLAASLQGIAQATGMTITKNNGARDKALSQQFSEEEAEKWHKANIRTIVQNNIVAISINGCIAISFYFARQPLAKFFLADGTDSDIQKLAETLLWINMVGLIPDAARIVSGGALRSGKDIMYPTMVSFLLMIVVGVPAGWGLGKAANGDGINSEAAWLFNARNITMCMAAFMVALRCQRNIAAERLEISRRFSSERDNPVTVVSIQDDPQKQIEKDKNPSQQPFARRWFSFFPKRPDIKSDGYRPLSDNPSVQSSQSQPQHGGGWRDRCVIL
jgi:Na+-driven multidrug efflux pump